MKQANLLLVGLCSLSLMLTSPALAAQKCASDSAQVGATCVDLYEASVWEIPAANTKLINKVKQGKATLADLTGGGATQRGVGGVDDYPCDDNGNDCTDMIYAVSIPGVKPSANLTWFQAQQACENAGKRLLHNAEWQQAAAGTPDPGVADDDSTTCNTTLDGFPANDPVNTGSRAACVSNRGVFDMVGNVWEWVADWVPRSTGCGSWDFSVDIQCLADAATSGEPGALIRGGHFAHGTGAGVFAVSGGDGPGSAGVTTGFRCGR